MSDYRARTAYQDDEVVAEYEQRRFGSRFGRYVWRREQEAVTAMLDAVGTAGSVLDCPSGFGRWLPAIERLEPHSVLEADISAEMLAQGRRTYNTRWPTLLAQAESLPFADDSFDLVFSHAFTKHLPHETQAAVLRELGRVARSHVIASFSVREGLPGVVLAGRERFRGFHSNAVRRDWLERAARDAGLRVVADRSCTSPVGTERTVLFATS